MKKIYKVAVVGAGSISQAHMNGYNLNKDRVEIASKLGITTIKLHLFY